MQAVQSFTNRIKVEVALIEMLETELALEANKLEVTRQRVDYIESRIKDHRFIKARLERGEP